MLRPLLLDTLNDDGRSRYGLILLASGRRRDSTHTWNGVLISGITYGVC